MDVRVVLPDGRECRVRKKAPCTAKSGAMRWAEGLERNLLLRAPEPPKKEVPTLSEFAPTFIDGHARANRHKPGGIAQKEMALRVHLLPPLGHKRLDSITTQDVQLLKHALVAKAPRTVNNVLTVLNTLLKKAVEWGVIEQLPCSIRLLKVAEGVLDFYDFHEYESLVVAAERVNRQTLLLALLGGDAGLRSGEMRALEWTDVDLAKRQLRVARNDWRGHITATKGGRVRHVPLTRRLALALHAHRHLRGPRVLCHADGRPLAEHQITDMLQRAARLAPLRNNGAHILRHTFCSHLAMKGVPARSIQELAGHKDLTTTMRYMHLSPSAVTDAIRLLEMPYAGPSFGEMLETPDREDAK